MSTVKIHDKTFRLFLDSEAIQRRVKELALLIDNDYRELKPLFIAVLNGSFIFAADMFRHLNIEAEISFIKLASYKDTTSTGNVVTAIGMDEVVTGRHVILLEDIVDTGRTLHSFLPELLNRHPASLKVAALLCKPDALQFEIETHYCGFKIPYKFVVGYGLDYNGLGRNLEELYELAED